MGKVIEVIKADKTKEVVETFDFVLENFGLDILPRRGAHRPGSLPSPPNPARFF